MQILACTQKDLETTLITTIKSLCQSDIADQMNVQEMKVMRTEAFASVIEKLGFEPVKFKFGFYCYSIDKSIPVKAIEPFHWNIMPQG